MSLIIARHNSPKNYGMVGDSLWTRGGEMGIYAPKCVRIREWFVGGMDAQPSWQRMARALESGASTLLGRKGDDGGRNNVECWLRDAWEDVQPKTGPTESGRLPASGVSILAVGPEGIVTMDAYGAIVWFDGPHHAIGCAEAYAVGWLDCRRALGGTNTQEAIGLAMGAAIERYPSVGGWVFSGEVNHGGR